MQNSRGTSVLAALVFVAIFAIFAASYKITMQGVNPGAQGAAVLAASEQAAQWCAPGDVRVVDLSTGVARTKTLRCSVPDPLDPSRVIEGPDAAAPECAGSSPSSCVVHYCPPDSMVQVSGTCFVSQVCAQGDASCVRSAVQHAAQPEQAVPIIAASLLADAGETVAFVPGKTGARLSEELQPATQADVVREIQNTAVALEAEDVSDGAAHVREVADMVASVAAVQGASRPTAQISCQPQVADTGMTIGIAFGCTNAYSSTGIGFATNGALWGATTATIPTDRPGSTILYAVACTSDIDQAVASCEVQYRKPVMLFVSEGMIDANQRVAWVTRGVQSCTVTTDDGVSINVEPNTSGVALITGFHPKLHCITDGGETREVANER